MKTSNILLLIFLLLMVTLPLTLVLALRRKIGTTDYTEMHYGQSEKLIHRPLPKTSVLRVKSVYPFTLKCRLIPSDSTMYSFDNGDNDSGYLQMTENHDTVSLVYSPPSPVGGKNEHREQRELHVDLRYSDWHSLEVDGAIVTIDSSWQVGSQKDVLLKNQAQIRFGDGFSGRLNVTKGAADAGVNEGPGSDE